jgi:hypothetical protein
MFLGFRKSWGFQNIWIDWISRQTDTDNEIFTIGGSGAYNHSIFFYKHDFIMTHVASTAKSESDEHIRDNGGFYARIGFCNLNKGFPDSLSLSTGYTMSYNRIRNVTGFLYRNGSLTEIYFEYQDIGLKSSLYFGDGQLLIGGDDLYSSPYYIRNDLFWMFFRRSNITGKLEISLHIVEHLINFSQSFQLSVNLGGTHKANSEIKNPTR